MTQDFRLFRSALNSIMFLLIQIAHCVKNIYLRTLNSIMFLLIQNQIILLMLKYGALNSIMFLLILLGIMKIQQEKITFKFHYVSINSKFLIA